MFIIYHLNSDITIYNLVKMICEIMKSDFERADK